jgi:hypothetical protein
MVGSDETLLSLFPTADELLEVPCTAPASSGGAHLVSRVKQLRPPADGIEFVIDSDSDEIFVERDRSSRAET